MSNGALRTARERQGLGLREVARLAQISPAHLSMVETGKKRLSLGALHRLAPYLGLGPTEVVAVLREMGDDRAAQ